ncbi:venom allergen 5-like [Arctopsyche grandis]|uniref:venom allergen 5-like n=1 Tax=Arctopsyche grandis TaxID=121162 RepID=UPI00406D9616
MSVSSNEQKTIVNVHNELRKKVADGQVPNQPKAINMTYLEWDSELAQGAQAWANKKIFAHNSSKKHSKFTVGENLYMSFTSNHSDTQPYWENAVNSWFNEYKDYKYRPLVSDPKTGHYTQVIWADTKYVGCGMSTYMSQGMLSKLYVCNYGPAGNFINQYPYKV